MKRAAASGSVSPELAGSWAGVTLRSASDNSEIASINCGRTQVESAGPTVENTLTRFNKSESPGASESPVLVPDRAMRYKRPPKQSVSKADQGVRPIPAPIALAVPASGHQQFLRFGKADLANLPPEAVALYHAVSVDHRSGISETWAAPGCSTSADNPLKRFWDPIPNYKSTTPTTNAILEKSRRAVNYSVLLPDFIPCAAAVPS